MGSSRSGQRSAVLASAHALSCVWSQAVLPCAWCEGLWGSMHGMEDIIDYLNVVKQL